MVVKKKTKTIYESLGECESIQATSRISAKLHDTFYTFEFVKKVNFPQNVRDKINLNKEKDILWNEVNEEVDNQIQFIFDENKKVKD
jgi:hypothetical protein